MTAGEPPVEPGGATGPELSSLVAVDKVGTAGLERRVAASEAECAALAARLQVPAVRALDCRFTLRRGRDEARGEVLAEGILSARLVRDCVVTLEPFETNMTSAFRLKFVRAGTERDDDDPEADDEVPYEGGAIDLGEAAAEQLALDMDPYPRSPGAVLADVEDDARASPFAALRRRID